METFAHNRHTQGGGMPGADKGKALDEAEPLLADGVHEENWGVSLPGGHSIKNGVNNGQMVPKVSTDDRPLQHGAQRGEGWMKIWRLFTWRTFNK